MKIKFLVKPALFLFSSLIASFFTFVFLKNTKKSKKLDYILIYSVGLLLETTLNDLLVNLLEEENVFGSLNRGIFCGGCTLIFLLFLKAYLEEKNENLKEKEIGCCFEIVKISKNEFQTIFFVLTLSFHSLLEGFADLKFSGLVALFIHNLLEAFTIGTTLSGTSYSFFCIFFLCLLCSSMTPIGMLVSSFKFVNVIGWFLNGCAFGSMLYVIFIEILPVKFKSKKREFKNVIFLFVGFITPVFIERIVYLFTNKT